MTAATDKTRPQVYVLSALIALLAVMLYIRFGRSDAPTPAAAPAGTASQPSNQTSSAGGRGSLAVSDVKLDALKHQQAELADSDRNPFRFRPKPAPPRPVERTPPPPTYVPPPIVTGPPPPPPIPLKLVGLLTPPGTPPVRYAVLSDARGTPFYGKEGDLIEGRYRVLRIAADSIDVAYADGRGRQTLRLTPQ